MTINRKVHQVGVQQQPEGVCMLALGQALKVMMRMESGPQMGSPNTGYRADALKRGCTKTGHRADALEKRKYRNPATVPMPSEEEDDLPQAATPVNRRKRRGSRSQLQEHKRRTAAAHPIRADSGWPHLQLRMLGVRLARPF